MGGCAGGEQKQQPVYNRTRQEDPNGRGVGQNYTRPTTPTNNRAVPKSPRNEDDDIPLALKPSSNRPIKNGRR